MNLQANQEVITWMTYPECQDSLQKGSYLVTVKNTSVHVAFYQWMDTEGFSWLTNNLPGADKCITAVAEMPKGLIV